MRVPPLALAGTAAAAQHLIAKPVRSSGLIRSLSAGALGATSASFLVASVREFRRSQTTVDPMSPEQATSLVISGPHQLSRNPMYVGMAGLLAAHATARGSWPAVLPLLGFVGVIDRVQIPAEEAALRERFGSEFTVRMSHASLGGSFSDHPIIGAGSVGPSHALIDRPHLLCREVVEPVLIGPGRPDTSEVHVPSSSWVHMRISAGRHLPSTSTSAIGRFAGLEDVVGRHAPDSSTTRRQQGIVTPVRGRSDCQVAELTVESHHGDLRAVSRYDGRPRPSLTREQVA